MKIKKISGIILVRSDSKRLPNKCFLDFGKVNILEHISLFLKYEPNENQSTLLKKILLQTILIQMLF